MSIDGCLFSLSLGRQLAHICICVRHISCFHPDRLIANHPSLVKPPPLDINHNLYSNILRAMILE